MSKGVSYYLSAAAVDNVLACVKALSPAGSSLGFEYASVSAEVFGDARVQEFRRLTLNRYTDIGRGPPLFCLAHARIME